MVLLAGAKKCKNPPCSLHISQQGGVLGRLQHGGFQMIIREMHEARKRGCKRGIASRADLPENVNREISEFFVRCHPNWEAWEAQ